MRGCMVGREGAQRGRHMGEGTQKGRGHTEGREGTEGEAGHMRGGHTRGEGTQKAGRTEGGCMKGWAHRGRGHIEGVRDGMERGGGEASKGTEMEGGWVRDSSEIVVNATLEVMQCSGVDVQLPIEK